MQVLVSVEVISFSGHFGKGKPKRGMLWLVARGGVALVTAGGLPVPRDNPGHQPDLLESLAVVAD